MHKMTHPFDYLNLWDSWEDSKFEEIISDETMAIMQDAVQLLDDETKKERLIVTRENFVSLVRQMHKLCKDGSRSLGNAIIKAWEYEEVGDFSKAIEVFEHFLSSCKSKFYRDIARGYIRKYSEQI